MIGLTTVEQRVDRDFARARRRGFFGRLATRFLGERGGDATHRLACFEEAKETTNAADRYRRGFETVELDRVVGSVGRCLDFDRGFLPVCSCSKGRWKRVARTFREGRPLPPVELYKLGERYFVLDGNHRVSVARYLGAVAIDAVVTELFMV